MQATEEEILVIPAKVIESIGSFEGFQRDVERYLPRILSSEDLVFKPRTAMERDPAFKQLIPYVLLQWIDPSGDQQLFAYTRGSGQGESRLHARRSVGIGGHISVEDAQGSDCPYETGLQRELDEEVRIDASVRSSCVGLIYDPSTEVGRVHLGIVHRFVLDQPSVFPNEKDICDASFQTLASLRADFERLETWSQLCVNHLFNDDDATSSC